MRTRASARDKENVGEYHTLFSLTLRCLNYYSLEVIYLFHQAPNKRNKPFQNSRGSKSQDKDIGAPPAESSTPSSQTLQQILESISEFCPSKENDDCPGSISLDVNLSAFQANAFRKSTDVPKEAQDKLSGALLEWATSLLQIGLALNIDSEHLKDVEFGNKRGCGMFVSHFTVYFIKYKDKKRDVIINKVGSTSDGSARQDGYKQEERDGKIEILELYPIVDFDQMNMEEEDEVVEKFKEQFAQFTFTPENVPTRIEDFENNGVPYALQILLHSMVYTEKESPSFGGGAMLQGLSKRLFILFAESGFQLLWDDLLNDSASVHEAFSQDNKLAKAMNWCSGKLCQLIFLTLKQHGVQLQTLVKCATDEENPIPCIGSWAPGAINQTLAAKPLFLMLMTGYGDQFSISPDYDSKNWKSVQRAWKEDKKKVFRDAFEEPSNPEDPYGEKNCLSSWYTDKQQRAAAGMVMEEVGEMMNEDVCGEAGGGIKVIDRNDFAFRSVESTLKDKLLELTWILLLDVANELQVHFYEPTSAIVIVIGPVCKIILNKHGIPYRYNTKSTFASVCATAVQLFFQALRSGNHPLQFLEEFISNNLEDPDVPLRGTICQNNTLLNTISYAYIHGHFNVHACRNLLGLHTKNLATPPEYNLLGIKYESHHGLAMQNVLSRKNKRTPKPTEEKRFDRHLYKRMAMYCLSPNTDTLADRMNSVVEMIQRRTYQDGCNEFAKNWIKGDLLQAFLEAVLRRGVGFAPDNLRKIWQRVLHLSESEFEKSGAKICTPLEEEPPAYSQGNQDSSVLKLPHHHYLVNYPGTPKTVCSMCGKKAESMKKKGVCDDCLSKCWVIQKLEDFKGTHIKYCTNCSAFKRLTEFCSSGKFTRCVQCCNKRDQLQRTTGKGIRKYRDQDVLAMKGIRAGEHPGNMYFTKCILERIHRYEKGCHDRELKMEVFNEIKKRNPPGRFLKKEADGLWYEQKDAKALEKIGSAFRTHCKK